MATYDLTTSGGISNLKSGDIINCPYSGTNKSITLPSGTYKFEVWGAQGGSYSSTYVGGKGGYAAGTFTINTSTICYVYVGGQGTSVSASVTGGAGGYNGGGKGGNGSSASKGIAGSGGGGASDIRFSSTALTSRQIVAGGGGGSSGPGCNGGTSLSVNTAVSGGAAEVAGGASLATYGGKGGGAGTSTSGGAGGAVTTSSTGSSDGTYYAGGGGGGGGGYYGGGGGGGGSLSSSSQRGLAGSAGTSGSGGDGGDSYTRGAYAYYGSGGGSGGGGSNYIISTATSTTSKNGAASFTSPSGTNETGHSGDGYCRITVISVSIQIIYNANGGTSTPETQIIIPGTSVTLAPAISKNNSVTTFTLSGNGNGGTNTSTSGTKTITYTFAGWNTNSSGTGTNYSASQSVTFSDDIILYAKWTESVSYSGNYHINQIPIPQRSEDILPFEIIGNGNPAINTSTTGKKVTQYTFSHWNTVANGSGTSYQSTDSTAIYNNITLYAQWTSNIIYRDNKVSDLPVPTRQKYNFIKWTTNADGSGTSYQLNSSSSFTSAITLYAQWERIKEYVPYIYTSGQWKLYKTSVFNSSNWKNYIGSFYE